MKKAVVSTAIVATSTLLASCGFAGVDEHLSREQQRSIASQLCDAGDAYFDGSIVRNALAARTLRKGVDELSKVKGLSPDVQDVLQAARPLVDIGEDFDNAKFQMQATALRAACKRL